MAQQIYTAPGVPPPLYPHGGQYAQQVPIHMAQPMPQPMPQPMAPPMVMQALPQPQVVNQTQVVVGQQPGAGAGAAAKGREWDTGLCGCCDDCNSCWLVCLFGGCYMCYMSDKLKEGCFMPVGVCPTTVALMSLRLKLRSKNNIKGSILKDFCVSHCICCAPCALCQIARQYQILKRNKNYTV